ncbi:MAG: DNA/RNA helicase domain-containing protein [Leucobacter sp.]
MTNSELTRIETLGFKRDEVSGWRDIKGRHHDWPVVYLINNQKSIYVGESTRARLRFKQHLADAEKQNLREIRILLNEEFNKSACLDLESRLISWLHADAHFAPINRNDGQQNSSYFERKTRYQPIFDAVFEQLRAAGLFKRSVEEIENLNLFKLSPFKALNDEQLIAVDSIVESLFEDLRAGAESTSVVQGGPGTGKTIVAIYLLKLLRDIQAATSDPDPEEDGRFNDFFQSGYREALKDARIAFVVPQQSLRKTIQKVFKRTPGLSKVDVLSPYTVAASAEHWDVLVIDEAHRLTHRGSGTTRGMFNQRSRSLFGDQASDVTAVDWIKKKSNHQIFLVDGEQSVRPADVPAEVIQDLNRRAKDDGRFYSLESQMRVAAGDEYLEFARRLLTDDPIPASVPETYDLVFFDNLALMRAELQKREAEVGLSRLVAGYAWPWASQKDKGDEAPYDIELDGARLRWNRTATDWIASPTSSEEVGSVHTVQGYDLNYAGVIIGPDIVWDEEVGCIRADRANHFDREVRGTKSETELLEYIRAAYYVLLTRGMRGTYVYVCDPALRGRIRRMLKDDYTTA